MEDVKKILLIDDEANFVAACSKTLAVKGCQVVAIDKTEIEEMMKDVQISVIMRSPNMANNFVVTTCLLENWAFKKPVVVPKLESFEAVIKDWRNGVFFEPGDSEDLAKILEEVYIKTDTYERLVKSGLKTAEREFSHRKVAKNMVSALSSYL